MTSPFINQACGWVSLSHRRHETSPGPGHPANHGLGILDKGTTVPHRPSPQTSPKPGRASSASASRKPEPTGFFPSLSSSHGVEDGWAAINIRAANLPCWPGHRRAPRVGDVGGWSVCPSFHLRVPRTARDSDPPRMDIFGIFFRGTRMGTSQHEVICATSI